MLDEPRVKSELIARWLIGRMDALVKVLPASLQPSPDRPIGYCTSLKFVIGRNPLEMERLVGLRDNSKLLHGAAIYMVRPLPTADQFHLRGHSNTPAGISTNIQPAHPDYPPGLGCPQWDVFGLTQDNLVLLARLMPGETFRCKVDQLPALY